MARERFKHLSFTDRLKIEAGLKMKMSVKQIAESIGVHISTVYREIKRGVYLKKSLGGIITDMRSTIVIKRLIAPTLPSRNIGHFFRPKALL